MGCDGGTIPKRDELVRTKKKPEQKDKKSERAFRWKHCAVSQEPLQKPVVACELGRLYNKDAVIEALLDKSKATDVVSHLRSLKDVKDLKLTENPAWKDDEAVANGESDEQKAKWICPVVGQEMNGQFRFVFIWTCGCVFSERALKEIGKPTSDGAQQECLKCLKPFSMDDVILLNPTEEEEITQTREKMEARRERVKNAKKAKKNGNVTCTVTCATSEDAVTGISEKVPVLPQAGSSKLATGLKRKEDTSGLQTPQVGTSIKKSKIISAKSSKSLSNGKVPKVTTPYSVSKDPNASETFKSLFTTHSTAAKQEKAHWVTYNPFYN